MAFGQVKIKVGNLPEFKKSTEELWKSSRLSSVKFLEKQGRRVLTGVINITPPHSQKTQGMSSKAAGESAVEGDIRKILMGVKASSYRSNTQKREVLRNYSKIKYYHRSRRKRGRIKGRARSAAYVQKANQTLLNRYIKRSKRGVGSFIAGWAVAGRAMKVKPRNLPGWVIRHSHVDGDVVVPMVRDTKGVVKFINKAHYSTDVAGMDRRIAWAMGKVRGDNAKILNDFHKKGAKQIGWKVA